MPKKLSEQGSAPVHLRLPPAELDSIDRAAELRQVTRSQVIRLAIQRGREQLALEQLVKTAEEAKA